MTVEPHQLEKGNITAHSGHWKQENTFLAKLWRYILGGLETQKFWISSFQRHAASGGFYSLSDSEKCNWQLRTCMKDVAPGLWPLQLFLMVAIHFPCLNFEPWPAMCTCISCEWQPKNMIARPEKPVWPWPCPQWLLHLLFCTSMLYVTFISAPIQVGVGLGIPTRPWILWYKLYY